MRCYPDSDNCFQLFSIRIRITGLSKWPVIRIHNCFQKITVFKCATVFKSSIFTWVDMHNWFQTVFKLLSNRFQAVFLRKTVWIWNEYGPCSNWFQPQNSLNSSLNPDNWSSQSQQLFDFNNWQITSFKPINCFQSITVFKPNPDNWSFEIS